MFASDEDIMTPDYMISEEDEEVSIIPPTEYSYLAMFIPMETILPLMQSHSQMFLAYLSSEGETKEEAFKMTMLSLDEFQRQYKNWQKHK